MNEILSLLSVERFIFTHYRKTLCYANLEIVNIISLYVGDTDFMYNLFVCHTFRTTYSTLILAVL